MAFHSARLGIPATDTITVWSRFTGAATIKLQYRKTGTTAWILGDTEAVQTTMDDTAVLAASGMTPGTKYDWRLLEDDVARVSGTVTTMLSAGRYVVYVCSDQHSHEGDSADEAFANILTDYQTNYEPSGIPAFIIEHGDFVADITNGIRAALLSKVATNSAVMLHLPIARMFDDHDWAGDNTSGNFFADPGIATKADAIAIQTDLWRDQPLGAGSLGSAGYSYGLKFCGIPFLFVDQRSMSADRDSHRGNQSFDVASCLGEDQREYCAQFLTENAYAGLIVLICGCSFKDLVRDAGLVNRDGWSIRYMQDRNYVVRGVPHGRNTFLVLSGDDHLSAVSEYMLGVPNLADGDGHPPDSTGLRVREHKTATAGAAALGGIFGPGNIFYQTGFVGKTVTRMDITPQGTPGHEASFVTMRMTYLDRTTFLPVTDPDGVLGDWYYVNGVWTTYDTDWVDSATQNQQYPGDAGHVSPWLFQRWYMDDINGTMHPEHDMGRSNWSHSLRDLSDDDEPGLDELRDGWDNRTEEDWPDPD